MCAAPTSAADLPGTDRDAAWERLQVEAAQAEAAGDHAAAAARWAEALRLARAAFDPDDPRLGTSLVNHAVALRRRGDAAADRLLTDALRIWERTPAWLARQPFARRARSSTFHLRLEAKHPGAYEANLRQRALSLLAEAREGAAMLAAGAAGQAPDPAALGAVRSAPRGTMRNLLAAVRLQAAPAPRREPEPPQEGS